MLRPFTQKRILIAVIALVVWAFFLWRAADVFKPGIYSATFYNSDCAIPVLMANDDRPVTLFNLYYYSIDRIGGWPFLIMQAVRRAIGFRWSPQRFSIAQTTWLFIGALAMGRLARKNWIVTAIIFLLVLCLHGETKYQIFTLAITYAWQVTALLLGWYCLRRFFDQELDRRDASAWKRVVWLLLVFWFCYLAIWSSIASIPFLLFLFGLEVLRMSLKRERRDGRLVWRSVLMGLAPILIATLAERLQKMTYYRHSLKHYGSDFRTRFEFDAGFLGKNLMAQVDNLIRMKWWPFHLLATLAMLALLGVLLYAFLRKRREIGAKLHTLFLDDTVILVVGLFGIALMNFMLAVVVSHVRFNLYEDRYLILTSLFGPVSAVLILFLMLQHWAQQNRMRKFITPVFAAFAVALLILQFPAATHRGDYDLYQQTATALAEKSPARVFLGDYWATYVVASLQPVGAMTPVPLNERENRMPWTRETVRQAEQVVIEYRRSGLEQGGQPPAHLNLYGNSLRLAGPSLYENGSFAYAIYVSESRAQP